MNGIEQGVWVVNKTLTEIMDPKFDSPKTRVLLLSIGLQESKFIDRVQLGGGPAHSFWQEEPNGIKAVLNNNITRPYMLAACQKLHVAADWQSIYQAVILNDELGCVVARLLLYADYNPLPEIGDSQGAWKYYLRNWKPGKPRPLDWLPNYKLALEQING